MPEEEKLVENTPFESLDPPKDDSAEPPGDPLTGTPRAVPLIRDDRGFVLVGKAKITGPDGGPLTGETFVDSEKLFTGQAKAVIVEPTGELTGRITLAGTRAAPALGGGFGAWLRFLTGLAWTALLGPAPLASFLVAAPAPPVPHPTWPDTSPAPSPPPGSSAST